MVVGVCKIVLRLPGNHSLKGKRQVIRSLTDRIRNQFNVAVAEVDQLDRWQLATLGITCISNEGGHANEMLHKVVSFVESSHVEAEVTDYEIDLVST